MYHKIEKEKRTDMPFEFLIILVLCNHVMHSLHEDVAQWPVVLQHEIIVATYGE